MIRRARQFVRSRPRLRLAILWLVGPAIPVVIRWYQRRERIYGYPLWLKARAALMPIDAALVPACRPLLFIALSSGTPWARRRTLTALRRQSDSGWRLLNINGSAASIAASKRQAASLGGWWMLLRPGDILSLQAVARLRMAAGEAAAEVIYADEDRALGFGWRWRPWFKPDFDAELLLVQNSFGSAVAYRAASLPADGKIGHALALDRASRWLREGTAPVRHIADVLLSRPLGIRAPWQSGVNRAAVLEALAADGRGAKMVTEAGLLRITWPLPNTPPLVSVIIPTRDRLDLLIPCVKGLLSRTDYPALEVIIADNDSHEAPTLALFAAWREEPRLRVLPCPGSFNYSRINNQAARAARGDVLLLLNNDTEVLEPGWLRAMVSLVIRPEIGAVGARLLYPDGRVQHAGVVLGLGGVAGHDLAFSAGDDRGPEDILCHTRTVSAATAACLAIRREVFVEVGGFDEVALQVAYNDVDLCLRINQAGYRNLVTPRACLLHKESASRGNDMAPEHRLRWERERQVMLTRWGPLLQHDPYYNASLAKNGTSRGLAWSHPSDLLAAARLEQGVSSPP